MQNGKVKKGTINISDEIEIVGSTGVTNKSVVIGVEVNNKQQGSAKAGETVTLLLRGIDEDQIEKGQIILKSY